MLEILEIYKCKSCVNIVEVVEGGGAANLVCCGEKMKLLTENTIDAAAERHVPIINPTKGGIKITIGDVNHPMEEKHYIKWIEVIADGRLYRQYLKPDDKPEASFEVMTDKITAREYCSLYGLWKAEF